MKYEWIQVDAYKDWSSLVTSVRKILLGIGTEYAINFTDALICDRLTVTIRINNFWLGFGQ